MALVHLYAAARSAAGSSSLELAATNLGELIQNLSAENSALAKLLPSCSYLLNGESCAELTQPIKEMDQIDVLPQFAGG